MNGSLLEQAPAPPPIDARLRARRITVRREEGRRRLRRLLIAVGVSLLVLAAWGVTRSPLLDVDDIAVVGATRSGSEAVIAASGIKRGDPLVDLDLDAAQQALTLLPWVAQAELTRSWNGSITIEIEERVATAVLQAPDGTNWLVDADGHILAEVDSSDGFLTVVGLDPAAVGEKLDPAPMALLNLIGQVPAEVMRHTAQVEVGDTGEIWFRLHPRPGEVDRDGEPRTDGGRIRFGDARAAEEELLAAATVLLQVDLTDLDVLDVRVPSNPIVTRVHEVSNNETTGSPGTATEESGP